MPLIVPVVIAGLTILGLGTGLNPGGCKSPDEVPNGSDPKKPEEPTLKQNCPPTLRKSSDSADLSAHCPGSEAYISDFVETERGFTGFCSSPFIPRDGKTVAGGRLFDWDAKLKYKTVTPYTSYDANPSTIVVTEDKVFMTVYNNPNNEAMGRGAGVLMYNRFDSKEVPTFQPFPLITVSDFEKYGLSATSRGEKLKDIYPNGQVTDLNLPGKPVVKGNLLFIPISGAYDYGTDNRPPSYVPGGVHVFSIQENKFINFYPSTNFNPNSAVVTENGNIRLLANGVIGRRGKIFTSSGFQDFDPISGNPLLTIDLQMTGAGLGLSNFFGLDTYLPTSNNSASLLKVRNGVSTRIPLPGEMGDMAQKNLVNNVFQLGAYYLGATGFNQNAVFILDPNNPTKFTKTEIARVGGIGKVAVTTIDGRFKVAVAEGNIVSLYDVVQQCN